MFTRRELAEVVINSLAYCQNHKGMIIYAWCLMPNHLHMIVSAAEGFGLSDIMRDFKKFTSKKVISTIQAIRESRTWMLDKFQFAAKTDYKSDQFEFWRTGFHPIVLKLKSLLHRSLTISIKTL